MSLQSQSRESALGSPEAYAQLEAVRTQRALEATVRPQVLQQELGQRAQESGFISPEASQAGHFAAEIAVKQITGEHQIPVTVKSSSPTLH